MKNKLLLSGVIIMLMVLPVVSFAETSTSSANVEKGSTIRDKIEAKKEALKNSVEERRQNALNKIIERVNQFVQNIIERFDAATNRLEKLADRINSRITKMEARNVDVAKAKELLAAAKAKIETAKISVTGIAGATIDTSLSTTTVAVKKDFGIIKTKIEKAKEDIKAAHAALVEVVNNLKPGQNKLEKENKTASTTEN